MSFVSYSSADKSAKVFKMIDNSYIILLINGEILEVSIIKSFWIIVHK